MALDSAWQALVDRIGRGELSSDDAVAVALAEAQLHREPLAMERARALLGKFWGLVHGNPSQALGEAVLASVLAQHVGPAPARLRAELERRRGIALFSLGRGRESVDAAQRGLALLDDLDSSLAEVGRSRAALLGFLGNAHLSQGEVTKSLVALEEAIALARAHSLDAELGVYLSSLGNTRIHAGDLRSAERYYEQALELAVQHGNREGEAVNTGNLGLVRHALGDLDGALEQYERALLCARELGDRRSVATLEANVGVVLAERGDLEGAQGRYDAAVELASALGDRATEAMALVKLAALVRQRDALDHAEELLHRVEAALGEVQDPRRSPLLDESGRVRLQRGQTAEARELFQEALSAAQEVGDLRGETLARYDLGRAADALSDSEGALRELDLAAQLARELEAGQLGALIQVARAEVLLRVGRREEAERALQAAAPPGGRPGRVLETRHALAQAASLAELDPERAQALLEETKRRAERAGLMALAAEASRRMLRRDP